MSEPRFLHLGGLRDIEVFQRHLRELHISIPCDPELVPGDASPLAQPLRRGNITLGNRFAIHPMEGWDGTIDGRPTELTFRRWRHFGASGAKLIWGGEAVTVAPTFTIDLNHESSNDTLYSIRDLESMTTIRYLRTLRSGRSLRAFIA